MIVRRPEGEPGTEGRLPAVLGLIPAVPLAFLLAAGAFLVPAAAWERVPGEGVICAWGDLPTGWTVTKYIDIHNVPKETVLLQANSHLWHDSMGGVYLFFESSTKEYAVRVTTRYDLVFDWNQAETQMTRDIYKVHFVPRLKTVLMDRTTFDRYEALHGITYLPTIEPWLHKLVGGEAVSPTPPGERHYYYWYVAIHPSRGSAFIAYTIHGPRNSGMEEQLDRFVRTLKFSLGPRPSPAAVIPTAGLPLPWIWIVGGVASVAAAAAAMIVALGRTSRTGHQSKRNKQQDNPTVGYVLQAERGLILLEIGRPEELSVKAWRVMADGSRQPAPEAQVWIQGQPAWLTVTPPTAMGELRCRLSLSQPLRQKIRLTAAATAGGSTVTGEIEIVGELKLGAWIEGRSEAEAWFNRESHCWEFPEIVGFLHAGDEMPLAPPFAWAFDAPLIAGPPAGKTAPPVMLQIKEHFIHDANTQSWTMRLTLASGVDLLDDPSLQNWLLTDGRVYWTVTVREQGGGGRQYSATVVFRIRPTIEPVVYNFDGMIEIHEGRVYKNFELQPFTMVADGADRLSLGVIFRRTDDATESARSVAYGEVASFQLTGMDGEEFVLKPDPDAPHPEDPSEPKYFLLTTPMPRLYTERRAALKPAARFTGAVGASAPNCRIEPSSVTAPIELLFPHLSLWVVPARQRGFSSAWGYACLAPNRDRPLTDLPVWLAIHSPGAASLTIVDSAANKMTDGKGRAAWDKLAYAGMSFANIDSAQFTVTYGVGNREKVFEQAGAITIDVKRNVESLLEDLFFDREKLKLTNPFWGFPELKELLSMSFWRPHLRGPVWNFCSLITMQDKDDNRIFRPWVCSELRDRIGRWLCRRRHYHPGYPAQAKSVAAMNGIEFEYLALGEAHAFMGLFLSGQRELDEPRCLDPWWQQHWRLAKYRTISGLPTLADETNWAWETNVWIGITAGYLMGWLIRFVSLVKQYLGREAIAVRIWAYTIGGALLSLFLAPSPRSMYPNGIYIPDDARGGYLDGIHRASSRWPYHGYDAFLRDWLAESSSVEPIRTEGRWVMGGMSS
jgi:hypothetical protein